MDSGWTSLRTIVESAGVPEAIDDAKARYERLDEAWMALLWLLARKGPSMGLQKNFRGTPHRLYVQAGDGVITPSIAVVFTTSDDEVVLIAAKVLDGE